MLLWDSKLQLTWLTMNQKRSTCFPRTQTVKKDKREKGTKMFLSKGRKSAILDQLWDPLHPLYESSYHVFHMNEIGCLQAYKPLLIINWIWWKLTIKYRKKKGGKGYLKWQKQQELGKKHSSLLSVHWGVSSFWIPTTRAICCFIVYCELNNFSSIIISEVV